MSAKTLITKAKQLLSEGPRRIEAFTVASRPYAVPVPIRYGDLGQLTAKEQGETYLRTVLGR